MYGKKWYNLYLTSGIDCKISVEHNSFINARDLRWGVDTSAGVTGCLGVFESLCLSQVDPKTQILHFKLPRVSLKSTNHR